MSRQYNVFTRPHPTNQYTGFWALYETDHDGMAISECLYEGEGSLGSILSYEIAALLLDIDRLDRQKPLDNHEHFLRRIWTLRLYRPYWAGSLAWEILQGVIDDIPLS